jgi:hypothetical protein
MAPFLNPIRWISMLRFSLAVALSLSIMSLCGCGSSPGDSLMNDMIRCMNELADAIEKKVPEDKLTAIQTRMKELGEKLDALKLSEDDKNKLVEKHRDAMAKAAERMQKAMMGQLGNLGNLMPNLPKAGK